MAGIEKICELSGEYSGHIMYKWKRNSIQIMPKYRKLFHGSKAVLIFEANNKSDLLRRKLYDYCLVVPESHLQGEVSGKYFNWSYKPMTVLRKMKRLTRKYKLKIKWSNNLT